MTYLYFYIKFFVILTDIQKKNCYLDYIYLSKTYHEYLDLLWSYLMDEENDRNLKL